MKNFTLCPNCSSENPIYHSKCKNCGAFIRDRVINVDLWSTIGQLVESPVKGFTRIIEAEHKNFVVFIWLLAGFKFWVDANFIYLAIYKTDPFLSRFVAEYLIVSFLIAAVVLAISVALKFTTVQLKTRVKDVFSLITYSFIPHFFGAIILFTIELIIFGGYLFSNNPSPFILKETAAVILSIFEGLIIIWGILLSVFSFYALSRSRIFSVLMAFVVNAAVFASIYFCSLYMISK